MTCHLNRIACALIVLAACSANPAGAQSQEPPPAPNRPTSGLFRGDQHDVLSRESLSLTGSISGAYDSRIVGPESITDPLQNGGEGNSGAYSTGEASLIYSRHRNRTSFGANVTGSFAFYPDLRNVIQQPVDSYQGGVNLSAGLGPAQVQLAQTLGYQPYFLLQTFPALSRADSPLIPLIAPIQSAFGSQVSLLNTPAITYGSAASLTTPLGRRSSFGITYGYQGSNYSGVLADINNQSATLQLSRSITRTSEIHGSYAYQLATYHGTGLTSPDTTGQTIDVGFSQRRRLSATRTLRLSAGGGTSILNGQFSAAAQDVGSRRATAHAGLDLQFGRTWSAQSNFNRSLQVLQGLAQPFFGNAVDFGLRGGLGRRLDIAITGSYSEGGVGVDSGSRGYDTLNSSLQLRYALSRGLAVSGEYINSNYDFGPTGVLPPGIIRRLTRHGVRLGLTWGLPLIGRQAEP